MPIAFNSTEVLPPPAAFVGGIGPQNLNQVGKNGYYLEGGGTQIWLPRDYPSPAVNPNQVTEWWYTDWNTPTSALQAFRNAGRINECDL